MMRRFVGRVRLVVGKNRHWFSSFCKNEPEIIFTYDPSAEREGSVYAKAMPVGL
jgi:hypothetical protein